MYVCPGSNDESIVAYNKKRKVKKKKIGGWVERWQTVGNTGDDKVKRDAVIQSVDGKAAVKGL